VKSLLSLATAALLLAMTLVPSQAAQRFGAFVVFESPDYILMDGDITASATSDFRKARAARPNAKVLALRSAGGYVDDALKLAGAVRGSGISTAIPGNFYCYSACAYLFFAGREHIVTGKLGVHRVGEPDGSGSRDADAYYQVVKNDIQRFVPKNVMPYLESTPTESMHVFSRKEIAALKINRGSSSSLAARFAATQ